MTRPSSVNVLPSRGEDRCMVARVERLGALRRVWAVRLHSIYPRMQMPQGFSLSPEKAHGDQLTNIVRTLQPK